MAIGLTFEEYVELKLMPHKHADRVFHLAAEQMRDEKFPMSLINAAWNVRTRGYDCRPESLKLLVKQQTVEPVKQQTVEPVDVDAWAIERFGRIDEYLCKANPTLQDRQLVEAFVNRIEIEPDAKQATVPLFADLETAYKYGFTRDPRGERLGKFEKMERFADWGGCLSMPMRERFALEGSEHTLIPTKQPSISS